ncbi:MAG: iron-containing alcohol dehydrogenase [Candidatus Woesearchaeota archaeon]
MENFIFQNKTKIIFGKGTELKVGEEVAKELNKQCSENNKFGSSNKNNTDKTILLHYGTGSIKKTGLYDKVIRSLKDLGLKYVELGGVVPNPRLSLVKEGIKVCKKNNVSFIIAVGGGSVIDSAKAIAAGFYYEGDVWELFGNSRISTPVNKALPIGVILTIPAAGSESSSGSVITKEGFVDDNGNKIKARKLHISSPILRPKFAIMNPELTFTLPDYQTACGVADMLAHIFERYFTNTKHVDFTDKLCEATMKTIIKNTRLALKDPKNYDYRAEIMWSGTLAHNGLLGTGREEDWASHVIEHELSAMFDITHGAGLSIVFPAWMRYVYKHDIQRFVQFAVNVFDIKPIFENVNLEETALKGITALEEFFKDIGLPTKLSKINEKTGKNIKEDITDEMIEEMSALCTADGPVGNFVKLKKEDVVQIFNLAK